MSIEEISDKQLLIQNFYWDTGTRIKQSPASPVRQFFIDSGTVRSRKGHD